MGSPVLDRDVKLEDHAQPNRSDADTVVIKDDESKPVTEPVKLERVVIEPGKSASRSSRLWVHGSKPMSDDEEGVVWTLDQSIVASAEKRVAPEWTEEKIVEEKLSESKGKNERVLSRLESENVDLADSVPMGESVVDSESELESLSDNKKVALVVPANDVKLGDLNQMNAEIENEKSVAVIEKEVNKLEKQSDDYTPQHLKEILQLEKRFTQLNTVL